MLLDDFKHAVDSYSVTISPDNLEQVCEVLEIDTTNGYRRSQVTDKLHQNIREAIHLNRKDKANNISRRAFLKLQSDLVYRYVLYNENPVEYLKVLKVIQDSCRHDEDYLSPFSNTSDWEKAIVNAKNYNAFSSSTFSTKLESLRKDYPKDFDIATSVKRLIDKGCKVEIIDSNFHIVSGFEAIVEEINEKVKTIGGVVLAQSLFNHLNNHKKYSVRFERYFITREASGISFDQRPQIPYGFLLNLSLKHLHEKPKIKNLQTQLDEIVDLAIMISNSFGVQQYNFWEFHFQSGETVIQFYTDIVLWDTMFTIPQCRPSSALDICENLFSFISESDFQNALGFTRTDFLSVSAEVNKLATNVHSPTIVYHSSICKSLKQIDTSKIQTILDLLSHQSNINKKYNLPSDYTSIDFWKKPLMKLGATKFLLMNKSWCAPNYFEAIASALRTNYKSLKRDLDYELGEQLEIYLQHKLRAKGITFTTGDYDVDGLHGECDLLIESEKAIILIEFKKKVLTGKAKSGVDTELLIDLSKSILDAQVQAGRTEIILREKGSITLTSKDRSTQTVNLNDRHIERVALTQLEFGGFHDRSIFKHLLTALLTHSYGTHSTDTKTIEKFEELKEKQAKWVEQYNKLCLIDTDYSKHPFFDCWFMSLPQLLEVINLSSDNNSFYEILRKTKHVSLNTLDWYREFDIATHLEHETR
ncbi:hypothetical protein J8J42_13005 [Chryseobacterium sp. cx-311]|uniref:hypothetical protein n=1 Tax=Marnyiella aurantia TaxID=2758037 RepID=UPI001AE1DA0C|nr:hypothetical protein [Marnyiella aurantia]MBP0613957.1 hypothetical protein [Marnyiella aurantia]